MLKTLGARRFFSCQILLQYEAIFLKHFILHQGTGIAAMVKDAPAARSAWKFLFAQDHVKGNPDILTTHV